MKVLCASISGGGHAYPMLAVAAALERRGHRVWFASGPAHERDAARAGAAFVALPRSAGSPRQDLRPYDDAASMAEGLVPVLRALAPDVVVHDVITMGPALAADAVGLPRATLVIHALHTPSRELPPFGFGAPPGRGPWGRLRDAWMRRGNRRDLERARADLNRARERLGLPPTERLDAQLSPDLVLVATLPSLEIPRDDWPPAARVVGPCLWEPHDGEPVVLPPGDAPLVLVAPSTAYEGDALVRSALEAVRRLRVRAVVAPARAPAGTPLPDGVVAARFASHSALLGHAAAVVCHGGHGTIARALSAGVPCVVVPGHGDQQENAYRVARAGAGVALREPAARPLARAIARVLSDRRFAERARALREEASTMDGPGSAAELIERLGAERAPA